ncbi:endopeptidase La [Cuneatibacter sp. NSJ-177]|uniref:endopeptidase La n=1 Tax=Cuneatibacter sp. NSJ-177 TaxID=2931401 RepID=UPI001FD2BD4E|nr:endopeptidase La [Cuneatibacter sp. NSJ-177]MCJ7833875.1 endopeptidase La [Cuneatibacter sp. NSJ-177]
MKLPVIALRGVVILPKMLMHFDISRRISVAAVERAMVQDDQLFLACQKDEAVMKPAEEDLHHIGTIATVKQILKLPNDTVRVLVEGTARGEIVKMLSESPFFEAEVEEAPYSNDILNPLEEEGMMRALKENIEHFAKLTPSFGEAGANQMLAIQSLPELMDQMMIRMPLSNQSRQELLELDSTYARYQLMARLLDNEIEIILFKQDIQEKVKMQIDKNQKEYLLREQIRVLRTELGEDEANDADHFENQVKKLKADAEVKEKIRKEIRRFRMMPSGSQEGTVSRTYIETLLELPWQKVQKENKNIRKAEKILNEDHYGLEKIKERILEYLAVRSFSGKGDGSILCLVGPPGTGKTSIARSVARALDKQYVRVSLGGVRDEAEIRGHRRTYIGAMPGRIVAGLKQAGVANPLMLLDEIDKVSKDYKGDTSSALLEVLDSEQNNKFRDHYVEIPVDLSKVLFIATANTTETIPQPLLDRMDIIEVSSYTENEKFHIGKDYLIGKQLEKNGLTEKQFSIDEAALKKIIHNYTREAGVRSLERRIGDLCRKAARELLEQKELTSVAVTVENLEKYLGKEKVTYDAANEEDQIGIVRGLAWTSVGGDTLQVEVNQMPGDGKLQLTGQLGDVMKESAQAGITYIRSVGSRYGIDDDYFEKNDIHVHIPEGAVPKDGPSAGITMATAVLSAVTGKKVKADLAMTGEITLRGRVLPVGGLKEKLLAAKLAGIHEVLVPAKNRPDIEELSEEITGGMELVYVSSMEEVIPRSFV